MNPRNLLVAAVAGGGVLSAHRLGYRSAAHGDHRHEQELLAATGHRYLTYLLAIAVAVAALLLWRYVARRIDARQAPDVTGFQLFAQAAVRLIPLQGLAFLALELGERAFLADGLTNVFAEPAVLMGIFFQVVVGLVGALLISAFAGVIEILRRRGASSVGRRPVVRVYPKEIVFSPSGLSLAEGGLGLRSPPSLP